MHTRTLKKGTVTPQETGPDLPVSCECPGVSSGGMGWWWPAAGSGALSSAVRAGDLLKEVAIIFITSTIVLSQVKQHGGNTALPINRKWNGAGGGRRVQDGEHM